MESDIVPTGTEILSPGILSYLYWDFVPWDFVPWDSVRTPVTEIPVYTRLCLGAHNRCALLPPFERSMVTITLVRT